jgi:hypothetical protein
MLIHEIGGNMRRTWLLAMLAGIVGAVVVTASGLAGASRLSFTSRTFRQTYTPLNFETTSGTIRCPVTLEGSLHSSTIAKVARTAIGYISRAAVAEAACTGGRARFAAESLPWQVQYGTFSGTLPNFTSLDKVALGSEIVLIFGGTPCRYIATPGTGGVSIQLIRNPANAPRITMVHFTANTVAEILNEPTCPMVAMVAATGSETVLGTTTSVSVTLI